MTAPMTEGKEWRHILLFTLPMVASSLLQQFYNTVDGIIVGNFVNETALSAVGTCAPLTMLFVALALGTSNGCSVMCAQYFGAGNDTELRRSVSTSLLMLLGMGILFTIAGQLLARPFLEGIMDVPQSILGDALLYFRIYCLGLLFTFAYNIAAAILRAVGDSGSSLYFLLISAITNIVLDLVFVAVFHWDVVGAAIATVIAQGAAALASVIYMFRRHAILRFRRDQLRLHRDKAVLGLKLGIPSAIQQVVVSCGNIAIQRVINGFGDNLIAGMTAGNRLYLILLAPCQGFNQGAATFAGQNIGAGRMDRVERGHRAAQLMAGGIGLAMGTVAFLLAEPLVGLFGLSAEAQLLGAGFVRMTALMLPISGVYLCTNGVIRGSGSVVTAMSITLLALLLRTVATYIFAYLTPVGEAAAWYGLPFDWIPALVAATLCYHFGNWRARGSLASKGR